MNKESETKKDPIIVWPRNISGYEIHKVIQRVGEIETYKGYCPGIRRRCVIKKIKPCGPDYAKEFDMLESKIKIISQSHHHSLCKYYTSFMDNDDYWVIMSDFKYTLVDVLKCEEFKDGFEIFEVVTIVSPIFRALAYLHSEKLYHGSVLSKNILFSEESIMLGGYEDKYRDHFTLSDNIDSLSEKQQDDIIDLLIILISLIKRKYKEKIDNSDTKKILLERNISKICTYICNILKIIGEDKRQSSQSELNMESIVMIERIAEVVGKNNDQIEKKNDDIENSGIISKKESFVPLSLKIISEWKKFELASQSVIPPESSQYLEGTQNSASTGMKICSSTTSVTSKSVNSAQLSTLKEPICVASSSTTANTTTMMTYTTALTASDNSMEKGIVDNNRFGKDDQLVVPEKLLTQQSNIDTNNDKLRARLALSEPIAQTPEICRENNPCNNNSNNNVNVNNGQLTKLELESENVEKCVTSLCKDENIGDVDDNHDDDKNKQIEYYKQQRYEKIQGMHVGDVLSFKSVLHSIMLKLKEAYSKQKQEKQQIPRLKRMNSKFSIQVSNNNNAQQLDKSDIRSSIQEQKKDSIIIKVSSPRCCCSSSHYNEFDEKQQQIKKTLPCGKVISVINPKCTQNVQLQQKSSEKCCGRIISMDCIGKNNNSGNNMQVSESQQQSGEISNSSIKKDNKASPIIVVGSKSHNSACQTKQISNNCLPQMSRKSIMVATVHNLVNQQTQNNCPKSCQCSISSRNQKVGCCSFTLNNNGKNVCTPGCYNCIDNHSTSSLPNSKSTTSIQGEKKGRFVIQASSCSNGFNPVTLQNCAIFSNNSASSSLQKGGNNSNNNNQRELKNMSLGIDAVQSCNALVSRIGRLKLELSTLTEENNRLLFLYRDLRARTEEESVSGQD